MTQMNLLVRQIVDDYQLQLLLALTSSGNGSLLRGGCDGQFTTYIETIFLRPQ